MTDRIRALGAELIVVGNGRPDQAATFKDELGLTIPLLVDPTGAAYRAAGLQRGLSKVFKFGTFRNAARAKGKGFRQKGVQGDPWQLGGTLLIAPGGKVLLHQISHEAGDHPDPQQLIAHLENMDGTARLSQK